MTNSVLHAHHNVEDVLHATASFLGDTITTVLSKKPYCNMALSGGSSPRRLYEILAAPPYDKLIPWDKVNFFFGDERYVPKDHPDSNYRMASQAFLEPLRIPEKNIFAVNTLLPPDQAARDYEETIHNHFGGDVSFDIILLGLGDDAHTASLFPHTPVLEERTALVKEVFVEEAGMYRITFTAPLINAGRTIVFLVYGASKTEAVHDVLEGEYDYRQYPAQLISPADGTVHWFVDAEARGNGKRAG